VRVTGVWIRACVEKCFHHIKAAIFQPTSVHQGGETTKVPTLVVVQTLVDVGTRRGNVRGDTIDMLVAHCRKKHGRAQHARRTAQFETAIARTGYACYGGGGGGASAVGRDSAASVWCHCRVDKPMSLACRVKTCVRHCTCLALERVAAAAAAVATAIDSSLVHAPAKSSRHVHNTNVVVVVVVVVATAPRVLRALCFPTLTINTSAVLLLEAHAVVLPQSLFAHYYTTSARACESVVLLRDAWTRTGHFFRHLQGSEGHVASLLRRWRRRRCE